MKTRLHRFVLAAAVAASILPVTSPASARPIADTGASPQRVVVGIEQGRERDARAAIVDAGGRIVKRGYKGRFFVVETRDVATSSLLRSALGDEPGISYAHVDGRVRATFIPNDPSYSGQWHLPAVGAPQAWDITTGDPAMKVAVLDTGADLDHPDLNESLDITNDVDFVNGDYEAQDDNIEYINGVPNVIGHGTHVSGIVAATMNNGLGVTGVAGHTTVLPVKVLDSEGGGFDSDVAQGILWATDHGAKVISMSFGATGTLEPSVEQAIRYAQRRDVVLVAAAGNTGHNELFYPAAYPGVLGVAATLASGDKASFSTVGSHVDIAAPGVNILSTQLGGGYVRMSGTSMATPLVAGASALVRSLHPEWTWDQVSSALIGSALDDSARPGRDDYLGAGRLDLLAALHAAGADDDIPGVPLAEGSITQPVNATADAHDVYALSLTGGKKLSLQLAANSGINARLLSADSTSVADADVLAETSGTVLPKTILWEIPADGTYFVDVTAAFGSGTYTLSWAQGYPTKTSLGGPATVAWGRSAELTGVVAFGDGTPISGRQVIIQARPYGGAWSSVATAVSDESGAFSAHVSPSKRTEYRAMNPDGDPILASTSPVVVVQPKAYLTTPYAPSSVYKGRYFTSVGYLKPRHTAGRRDVKLACYRSENGRWKYYKSVYATNANYGSYTKYVARLYLPYRGSWKIVASIAGDTTHVATTSGARYLTVK